jgi:hypothetical protein
MAERVMAERVMSEPSSEQIRALLDSLYRVDWGRIVATLIRLLGDFDLAEEAMHEAFAAALSLWPRSGVPTTRDRWWKPLTWTRRWHGDGRPSSPVGRRSRCVRCTDGGSIESFVHSPHKPKCGGYGARDELNKRRRL